MNLSNEMETLLKKIDDALTLHPDGKNIGIVEGGHQNINSLLYVLKGEGVIGLFRDVELPMSNEKGALEDSVYFFDVDRERFNEFKKGTFYKTNKPAKYDLKKLTITYQNREIFIPPDTNTSAFCEYMFTQEINTPISWDIIYENIVDKNSNDKAKDRKKIYDAMISVNKKFGKVFSGQKIFRWFGKSVIRIV